MEGAGAVGLAAVLGGKVQIAGKKVAVVLSGGNVDAHLIARMVEHGLAHAGRYLALRVMLDDRPGRLSRLLSIVSATEANVLDIGHLRHAPSVHLGQVEIQLTLETRNNAHAEEVRERLREAGYTLYESAPTDAPCPAPGEHVGSVGLHPALRRATAAREDGRNALWANAPCTDCPKGGQIYAPPLR